MINIARLSSIPSSITSIPTLVINNNKILKGKELFNFFSSSDEMEYINFSCKNNGVCFSSLNDNDNIESNESYTGINSMEYCGVPTWTEDNNNNTTDIDTLQAEREKLMSDSCPPK